jgi:hypothetical protein
VLPRLKQAANERMRLLTLEELREIAESVSTATKVGGA